MPTYQCNAACENCGTLSNPSTRIHLSQDQVVRAITEAAELDFLNVVFTGGEPTLRPRILEAGIALAARLGLRTRIVTNAYWAKTIKLAEKKISDLVEIGLDEINFSSGDQHARFVPMDRIVNAILAACEIGIRFHVMIETTSQNKLRKTNFIEHPLLFSKIRDTNMAMWIEESPWMPLDPGIHAKYDDGQAIDEKNLASCKGCSSILQTIVLQADGRIGACCGLGMRTVPELQVGHIDDETPIRRAIEIAEKDLLKIALRYLGAEKILAWSSTFDSSIEWKSRYAHRCQACMRVYKDPKVRKVIQDNIDSIADDVIYSAVFDEVLWPRYLSE